MNEFKLSTITAEEKTYLKNKIARVLSEILSEQHGVKITYSFTEQEQKAG